MVRLRKWCCGLFVALPLLAHADAVTIHANASGSVHPSSIWIYQFADADIPNTTGLLPFTVTVHTEFDAASSQYSESTSPPWRMSKQFGVPAQISFTFDGRTFNFAGSTSVQTNIRSDYFTFNTVFEHGFYLFDLQLSFHHPANGLSGHPLGPRTLDTDDGLSATSWLFSSRSNPDASGNWEDLTVLDNASLTVMSPVPEPGQASLLLAGVLTLLVTARGRRGPPTMARTRPGSVLRWLGGSAVTDAQNGSQLSLGRRGAMLA